MKIIFLMFILATSAMISDRPQKVVSEMQDCSCGQDECFEGDDMCNCGSCPDETH